MRVCLRILGIVTLAALVIGSWTFRSDIAALATFVKAWADLKQIYIDDLPSDQELAFAAIRGMLEEVEDCSFGQAPLDEDAPENANARSYPSGVRATHTDSGLLITNNEGGWGFREGDLVTAVRSQSGEWIELRALSPHERDVLLAGHPIHGVFVQVNGSPAVIIGTHEFSRARGEYPPISAARLLSKQVGYLSLRHFHRDDSVESEFESHVKALLSQGAEVLIIDLRNNPGGSSRAVELVAGKLFPQGTLITTQIYKESVQVVTAQNETLTLGSKIPLIVLVNENTASAAEVLAGAIQDHKRGVLIGETTYGKGYGSSLIRLDNGSIARVKSFYWQTPSGRSINGVGLTPDIIVPMPEKPNGTDPQLEKAIECAQTLLEGKECR